MPSGCRACAKLASSPIVSVARIVVLIILAFGTAGIVEGCARNPATGELQLALLSEEEEIALGRQSDEQIVAQMGLYPDEDLQRYVNRLGQDLAASSERPDLPWTFRVLDDPTANAFALPGGFVYITRGLLAHMGNEAELAAVLGHEIGHVTARHSVEQLSEQQLTALGLGVGQAILPDRYSGLAGLAQTGLGLLFLKFSRDDEREADALGVRYMVRDDYDPRQMVSLFQTLKRVSQAEGGGAIPAWASTHPTPADRIDRLADRTQRIAREMPDPIIARASYLREIDGLSYGENPRNGFFEGQTFHHPGLEFSIDLPKNWATINIAQAMGAVSPEQDALIQLTLATQKSAQAAAQAFFDTPGIRPGDRWREGGMAMPMVARTFRAAGEQGTQIAGIAAFIEHHGQVLQILALSSAGAWRARAPALQSSLASFRRLTDPALLARNPERIEITQVERPMTLAEFDRRYPSSVELDTLARLNQTQPTERIDAGQALKRVVAG